MEEEKIDKPLERAVAGPALLFVLTGMWGGIAAWGISHRIWFSLVLAFMAAGALFCGLAWVRTDKQAWERYNAQNKEESDIHG